MLASWGLRVARRPLPIVAASALFLLASLAVLLRGAALSTGAIEGIESARAQELIERELGLPGDASFTIVFRGEGGLAAGDPRFDGALRSALQPLRDDPRVSRVLSPADLPPFLGAHFVSSDRSRALAVVALQGEVRDGARAFDGLKAKVHAAPLAATFTGYLAFKRDLDRTLERDLLVAELVSIPLALLVLLWVFGTLAAALLPVLVGGVAVVGGVAAVFLLSHVTDMAQYAINVVSLIGLGVAIDYSLFIVSRTRDELAAGRAVPEAIAVALATAGRAVLFSGLAVFIGLAGLLLFPRSYLSAMGLGGAIVVLLAVLFSLTLLPALLALLGPRLSWGRVPLPSCGDAGAFWRRTAARVMARPLTALLPTLALLLLLGAPFLHLELAAADVSVLPAGAEARRGFDELRTFFPEQAATRLQVLAVFPDGPAFAPERAGPLYDLSRAIGALPGVSRVEGIIDIDPQLDRDDVITMAGTPPDRIADALVPAWRSSVGKTSVLLTAVTGAPARSQQARALVRRIRALPPPPGARLLVGGQSARDVDTLDFILGHAPYAVAIVIAATLVILFFALGSLLLPIKAVLMNLLSIAGSFGAMVFLFQDGHFAGPLRFEPGPIEPTLPIVLFCAVFGLSMDYEVLLLSRMQEEWRAHGDNARAVAEGLARSGRLITSAAAIMVAVFAAFASAEIVLVKAMGLGMAIAVALDATLVRMLIVPAAMRLLGDWNWWVPWGKRPR